MYVFDVCVLEINSRPDKPSLVDKDISEIGYPKFTSDNEIIILKFSSVIENFA